MASSWEVFCFGEPEDSHGTTGIFTNRMFDYLMGFYVGEYIHSMGPSGLGQVTLEFLGINIRPKKKTRETEKETKQTVFFHDFQPDFF